MTEQEIYDGIIRKDNATFLYLYNTYKDSIIKLIKRNNGNEDDALDILQEGLVALWTNVKLGKFLPGEKSKTSTYLYAICRNIWISRLRKSKKIQTVEDDKGLQVPDNMEEMEEKYEQVKQLERVIKQLGDTCQKLLKMFYYQKASLREIAQEFDIAEKSAKNNKYRCMQNLRAIFKAENSKL